MLQCKLRKATLTKDQDVERITFPSAVTAKKWSPGFRGVKSGRDLKLWINIENRDDDSIVEDFLKELTRIKEGVNYQNLRSLTLTFGIVSWRSKVVEIISKYIRKNFKNLQKFELTLPTLPEAEEDACAIPGTYYNPLAFLLGPHMKTLTSLHIRGIHFESNSVLKTLTKELRVNLRGLYTLHLDFQEGETFDDPCELRQLAKQITANRRTLQNVYLYLPSFRLHPHVIPEYIRPLKPDVNFKNLVIDHQQMKLTKSNQRPFSNQSGLNLFINNTSEINLKELLKSINKLSGLEIQFIYKVEDGLLKWIMQKFQALKRLSFYFRQIDNENILVLSDALESHLKGLESLHLDFRWCGHLTDDMVLDLASKIGINLSALQDLYLRFGSSSEASYKSPIIFFNRIIPSIRTLRSFYVEFEGYSTFFSAYK